MPDFNEKLVKDLYSKYAPNEQLSTERINAIQNKYQGDYKTLITDFYGKYAPNQKLNDERFAAISEKYSLSSKKKEQEVPYQIASPDRIEATTQLQPPASLQQSQQRGDGSTPQLNKERNVAKSFGKKAWETLAYQLPASGAASAAVAIGSGKDLARIAEGVNPERYASLNRDDIYARESQEEIARLADQASRLYKGVEAGQVDQEEYNQFLSQADERIKFLTDQGFIKGTKDGIAEETQKELVSWANERQSKGAEFSQDLVDTIDEIEDPIDVLNWTASAMGQGAAQILPTILTGGATSISQEVGGIYLDQINKVAEEEGITPEQVIDRGLDDKANAVAYGVTAGLLDKLGAGKVANSMKVDNFKKSMRQRAMTFLKDPSVTSATEGVTEGAQTILEEIGAGKDISEIDPKDIREAVAQGFVAGGGMSVTGKGISSAKDLLKNDKQKTETSAEPDQAVEQEQKPEARPESERGISAEVEQEGSGVIRDDVSEDKLEDKVLEEDVKDVQEEVKEEVESTEEIIEESQEQPAEESVAVEDEQQESVSEQIDQEDNQVNDAQDLNTESQKDPSREQDDSLQPERATIEFFDGVPREGVIVDRKDGKITIESNDGRKYTVSEDKVIPEGRPIQESGEKLYESPIGVKKEPDFKGRVNVDPIVDKSKPLKKLNEIQVNLSKGLGSKIYFTKRPSKRSRALGSYNPKNAAIAIKYSGDLDVTAHELGHSLEDRFGLLSNMPKEKESVLQKELSQFSKYGSKPPENHPNPDRYKMGEGVAEWVRAYIANPQRAEQMAPEFTKWYESAVDEKIKSKVKDFSEDIRRFAGATGHDAIMSNVRWSPKKQKGSLLERLKPKSTSDTDFSLTIWDKLGANWTNSMRAYEKAVDYLKDTKGIDKMMPSQNPKMLARVFLGVNEKFDSIMRKGMIDGKNTRLKDDKTGEAVTFEWLLKPLNNVSEKTITEESQEMISYMIAERTVELNDRVKRKNSELRDQIKELSKDKKKNKDKIKRLRKNIQPEKDVWTGIGAGIFKDIEVARKRLEEHKNLNKDKRNRIEESARRFRVFSDGIMKYMVDKGRMSEQDYNDIKKDNLHYVGLQRVMEAAPDEEIQVFSQSASKSIGSSKEVVKKIKGSSRMIKNPFGSLIETSYKAIQESDRNDVMLSFRELFTLERDITQGEQANLAEIARPASSGDKNTIKIYVDGDAEYWQLQPDVYKAVKNINDVGTNIPKFVTALPRLVRWTVTNFPVFALRNRIRDFQNRFVISDNDPESGLDIYTKKGVKSKTRDLYELFGAGQAGYYMLNEEFYNDQMEMTIKKLAKDKKTILANPKKMADVYDRMISSSEVAGRLEEYRSSYKKAKKQGMDDYNASIYAAFESRDLMDFAVSGYYMREINKLIPFSNAAVQGTRKTIRSAMRNPKGFALRTLLYSAAPALLNRIVISMMGEDEEYKELPAYQRDLFFNIPLGDGYWVTIPKPFEVGVMGSGFDRLFSKINGDEGAFDGYAGSVARSALFVDEATLAGPMRTFVETSTNYDFFRQKSIIPDHEEGKALSMRNTQWASRLGKAVQSAVGYDARKVDHIIKSTTTYFGKTAISLSDIGREDSKSKLDLTDLGVFKRSPVYNSKSVQWVMENAEKYNLTNDYFYQDLQVLVRDYFDAPNAKEADKRGEVIRKYARDLKRVWEEYGIGDQLSDDEEKREFLNNVQDSFDSNKFSGNLDESIERQENE